MATDDVVKLLAELQRTAGLPADGDSMSFVPSADVAKAAGAALELENAVWYEITQHPVFARQRAVQDAQSDSPGDGELSTFDIARSIVEEVQQELQREVEAILRGPLHLIHATEEASNAIALININKYDGGAWKKLIGDVSTLPLCHARPIWIHFSQVYPRAANYWSEYVLREIEEDRDAASSIDDSQSGLREKAKFKLRILNAFNLYLPKCISVRLFRSFLGFLQQRPGATAAQAQPPQRRSTSARGQGATWGTFHEMLIDQQYSRALSAVGLCLDATPLWQEYLNWKSVRINDVGARRQWVRGIYHTILSTPLEGLAAVREAYDAFELAAHDYRKVALEERLERLFSGVAHSLFPERAKFYAMLDADYLPHPLRAIPTPFANTVQTTEPETEELLSLAKDDAFYWEVWENIIMIEKNVESGTAVGPRQAKRIIFVLRQRLQFFPLAPVCWIQLAQQYIAYAMHTEAQAVFDAAIKGFPTHLLLHFVYVDACLRAFSDVDAGISCYRQLVSNFMRELGASWSTELVHIDSEPAPSRLVEATTLSPTSVEHALREVWIIQRLTHVYISWMRWNYFALSREGSTYVRLVTHHAMHQTKLFALIMRQLKRMKPLASADHLHERELSALQELAQLFGVFSSSWIEAELRLCGDAQTALEVMKGWGEHLISLLLTTKWTPLRCGFSRAFFLDGLGIIEHTPDLRTAVCGAVARVVRELDGLPTVPTGEARQLFSWISHFQKHAFVKLPVKRLTPFAAGISGIDRISSYIPMFNVLVTDDATATIVSKANQKLDGQQFQTPIADFTSQIADRPVSIQAPATSQQLRKIIRMPDRSRLREFAIPRKKIAAGLSTQQQMPAPGHINRRSQWHELSDAQLAALLLRQEEAELAQMDTASTASRRTVKMAFSTLTQTDSIFSLKKIETSEEPLLKKPRLESAVPIEEGTNYNALKQFLMLRLPTRHACAELYLEPNTDDSNEERPSVMRCPRAEWLASALRSTGPLSVGT